MLTDDELRRGLALFQALKQLKEIDPERYKIWADSVIWYYPYVPLEIVRATEPKSDKSRKIQQKLISLIWKFLKNDGN